MVDKAVDMACEYVNTRQDPPTGKELGLLEDLAESLAIYAVTVEAVTRNWRLRISDAPLKFTDPFTDPQTSGHRSSS